MDGTTGTAVAVAAGEAYSCAIQAGTAKVVCWGDNYGGAATPPALVDGTAGTASAISAAVGHTLAIRVPICADGIDNDGDTFVDYPTDPGCMSMAASTEKPQCNDGLDNDWDGPIDALDSDCTRASDNSEWTVRGCGIGPELAALLPVLWWTRRRVSSSGSRPQVRSGALSPDATRRDPSL